MKTVTFTTTVNGVSTTHEVEVPKDFIDKTPHEQNVYLLKKVGFHPAKDPMYQLSA